MSTNLVTHRYTHVVYADLECCGAGSIWDINNLVDYFETAKAARQHIRERKSDAGVSVETEESIIEVEELEGGDPYIFTYLYMRYPKSKFPTQRLVTAQFEEDLEDFLQDYDVGVNSPYVVEQGGYEV